MFSLPPKLACSFLIKSGPLQNNCIRSIANKFTTSLIHSFGQPTVESHPYLLKDDEITPLIKRSEYQSRRRNLSEAIIKQATISNKDSKFNLIVIPSATKQYMSDKIPYVFRQNTDFLYMTGCQEPDSCLVVETIGSDGEFCATLFLREKDCHAELWDGPRTGPEAGVKLFGVDQALPTSQLQTYLNCHLRTYRNSSIWYDFMTPIQISVHNVMCDYLSAVKNKMWESPACVVQKLRLIKSPSEIALMKKSCDITGEAFSKAMCLAHPGINEHKIFAQVDYECRVRGSQFLAYPPVVAGGDRANIIHYISDNQVVNDGELVLMDAGGEYHGYSSDVTRTWPINGAYTASQRLLYEVVLSVQDDVIQMCKNLPCLDSLYESMCEILGKRLQEIGIIPKNVTKEALYIAVHDFCPHHVSHYLGMDVHDTPIIRRNIKMEPGMVITVEPGVYISSKNNKVPKQFRGLGIRIEDDIVITENGPVVLSENCPRSITDIENIANKSS